MVEMTLAAGVFRFHTTMIIITMNKMAGTIFDIFIRSFTNDLVMPLGNGAHSTSDQYRAR